MPGSDHIAVVLDEVEEITGVPTSGSDGS